MADEKEQEKQEHTQPSEPVTPAALADKAAETDAAKAPEAGKEEAARAPRKSRGRSERQVPVGVVHIRATFNNTIVTITDPKGAVIAWSSSGRCGFKGSRKSTPFAAQVAAEAAGKAAQDPGLMYQGAESSKAKEDLVKLGPVVSQLENEDDWKKAAVEKVWPEMADFVGGKDAINLYLKSFGKAEWKP